MERYEDRVAIDQCLRFAVSQLEKTYYDDDVRLAEEILAVLVLVDNIEIFEENAEETNQMG